MQDEAEIEYAGDMSFESVTESVEKRERKYADAEERLKPGSGTKPDARL